jgi:ankyrin repeat protein
MELSLVKKEKIETVVAESLQDFANTKTFDGTKIIELIDIYVNECAEEGLIKNKFRQELEIISAKKMFDIALVSPEFTKEKFSFIENFINEHYKQLNGNILHLAASLGSVNIITSAKSYITEEDFNTLLNAPKINGFTPIMVAVVRDHIEAFDVLIKEKAHYTDIQTGNPVTNGCNILHIAASYGQVKVINHVKAILGQKEFENLSNAPEANNGFTPIMLAAIGGQLKAIEALKDLGAQYVNIQTGKLNTNGCNILHIAAANGQVAVFDHIKGILGHEEFEELLNAPKANGITPIMEAVANGRTDAIKALKDLGAPYKNIQTGDPLTNGCNILHIAASYGQVAVFNYVKGILKDEFEKLLNALMANGLTPIMEAVANGKTDAITALKDLGADYKNIQTGKPFSNGCNILHVAAANGQVAVFDHIKDILKDEFEKLLNAPKDNGLTPIMEAVGNGKTDAITALKDLGAHYKNIQTGKPYTNGCNILHTAASCGQVAVFDHIKDILKEEFEQLLNAPNNNGLTPIMDAVVQGKTDAITALKDLGAHYTDIQTGNPLTNGCNILHITASCGQVAVFDHIKDILKEEFEQLLNAPNNNGLTPIMNAVSNGQMPAIRALKDLGAQYVNIQTGNPATNGINILHIAAANGQVALLNNVKDILKEEFEQLLNAPNNKGSTPIMLAAAAGQLKAIEALKDLGAPYKNIQTGKPNMNGLNILHTAATYGQVVVFNYVKDILGQKEFEELLNAPKDNGQTPIMVAAAAGQLKAIEALKDSGAQYINIQTGKPNMNGLNILQVAASNGQVKVINHIKKSWKLPNFIDLINYSTPNLPSTIYLAIQSGRLEVIKLLILSGANYDQSIQLDFKATVSLETKNQVIKLLETYKLAKSFSEANNVNKKDIFNAYVNDKLFIKDYFEFLKYFITKDRSFNGSDLKTFFDELRIDPIKEDKALDKKAQDYNAFLKACTEKFIQENDANYLDVADYIWKFSLGQNNPLSGIVTVILDIPLDAEQCLNQYSPELQEYIKNPKLLVEKYFTQNSSIQPIGLIQPNGITINELERLVKSLQNLIVPKAFKQNIDGYIEAYCKIIKDPMTISINKNNLLLLEQKEASDKEVHMEIEELKSRVTSVSEEVKELKTGLSEVKKDLVDFRSDMTQGMNMIMQMLSNRNDESLKRKFDETNDDSTHEPLAKDAHLNELELTGTMNEAD